MFGGSRALVVDLLELARLDAADAPVEPVPIKLGPAVSAIVGRLGAEDAVEVNVRSDTVVLAEPLRLARVLTNLLANAVQHGGAPVRVCARGTHDTMAIAIEDEGPGLDPDDTERVFDRFYKADPARGGGSGLGLSIARQHTMAMNGSITAGNRRDGGACFVVRLPAGVEDDANDPGSAEQTGADDSHPRVER